MRSVPSKNPTLDALTRLVGKHGGATAPARNVPKGKAYGFHRKRQTPGANLGPLAGPHPSDASRRANFGRVTGRKLQAPRRSAPRPPLY